MKVRITIFDEEERPDLFLIQSALVKNTARVAKEVRRIIPRNRHTGEPHHESLSIRTWKKLKAGPEVDDERSITLEEGEIDNLVEFVQGARHMSLPLKPGKYNLDIPNGEGISSEAALRKLRTLTGDDRADALALLLRQAADQPKIFSELITRVADDPEFLAKSAAALNLAVYRKAVEELDDLIESEFTQERDFQSLLARNPWMFGSEYSHLEKKRSLTRDEQQDYLFSRTTDEYLEVVEIKTPLNGETLFGYDKSHNTFYQRADLSKVIAQVQNYLEELDAGRDSILRRDGIDPNKVRAKIVIGRDGDDDQRKALRRTNGHLHRIEIITFDGLLRIAKRVLAYLEEPAV